MSAKKTDKDSLIDRLENAAARVQESGFQGRGVVYRTIMEAVELLKSQCIYDPQYETNVNPNHDDYVRVGDVLDCFTGMDLNDDAVFHGVCLLQWAMSKRSIPKEKLLTEQLPRLLTLGEALGRDECWFEHILGVRGYADIYMLDNKNVLIYRIMARTELLLIEDYGKKWRCWSYRPDDEQRKAVKWDEPQ